MDDRCLLFFIKNPEKGKVKTRLASVMGDHLAVLLYREFILKILETLKSGNSPFYIFFYPKSSLKVLKEWLGGHYRYMPQKGKDLGERMKNGFREIFALGFRRVILIGSDLPDLPLEFIEEAFTSLNEKGVVLGPSYDGGYYLVGFERKNFLPQVFDGIPWSSSTVFKATMKVLKGSRRTVHILKHLRDIDTIEDLRSFLSNKDGE